MNQFIKMITFAAFCICEHAAFAQNGGIDKRQPEHSEKISISYSVKQDGSLSGKDTIFSGIQYWDEKGAYFKKTVALSSINGNNYSALFEIPSDAAYFSIRFYDLAKDDADATINSMVYRKGKPARGASYQGYGEQPHLKFGEEIGRYPDNYFAYARYIASLPSDTLEAILPKIVATLTGVQRKDDGLMAALVVAYSRQAKKEQAQEALFKLLDEFPASPCTDFAFSLFLYEQYKTGGSMLATG